NGSLPLWKSKDIKQLKGCPGIFRIHTGDYLIIYPKENGKLTVFATDGIKPRTKTQNLLRMLSPEAISPGRIF
ncbi:MAG: hypothetical protein J1E34_09005, partial [Oscillospiraceae bacterium]|nr:hypothetical protein [Oscillospiraceae bacterium]